MPIESTFSYFAATRAYLEQHGKPVPSYSDKARVFRVNAKDGPEGRGYTQFGRTLFELNIDMDLLSPEGRQVMLGRHVNTPRGQRQGGACRGANGPS